MKTFNRLDRHGKSDTCQPQTLPCMIPKPKMRLKEYRPQYHIAPPIGGANDVQCIFWRGAYHVFYGYLPTGPLGSAKQWGHASSHDLVHWTHHPPCLEPDPGATATWTGCLVDDNGTPTAFYTRIHPQAICMAASRDMIHWEKHSDNPVIAEPPDEFKNLPGFGNFRDPCVWRESDGWHMALGSGIPGKGSAVLLYHSPDLIRWKYMHPLFVRPNHDNAPDMFECPDFFELEDRYVLLVSTNLADRGGTLYFTGNYRDHKFIPDTEGWCDFGREFYAAKTLVDDQNRRMMWGWLIDSWSRDLRFLAGWSGAYSLPRILSLGPDRHLHYTLPDELKALRQKHKFLRNLTLKADEIRFIPGFQGRQLEVQLEWEPGDAAISGIMICCAPAKIHPTLAEQTRIYYDKQQARLLVDRSQSSVFHPENVPARGVSIGSGPLTDGKRIRLRLFLDHSTLEIFIDDAHCWSGRIYPFMQISDRVAVFCRGGSCLVKRLDLWTLRGNINTWADEIKNR